MTLRPVRCLAVAILALLASVPRASAEEAPDAPALSVFEVPAIAAAERRAAALAAAGDVAGAIGVLDRLIAGRPALASARANRAVLRAVSGDLSGAVEDLEAAHARGFRSVGRLVARPALAPLLAEPRVQALVAEGAAGEDVPPWRGGTGPALASGGRAPVTEANTRWDPVRSRLVAAHAFPPVLRRRPAVQGGRAETPAGRLLQRLFLEGRAAGHAGDLYDNRDRGHSRLRLGPYPQLSAVAYGEAARAEGADYGFNGVMGFDAPVFGNSSTAITSGPYARSQARAGLTSEARMRALVWQWEGNAVYVYPEHRDHDPVPGPGEAGRGRGDLFPANTPYMLVSQGSSGSDRPILHALAHIFAAFRPATKAHLAAEGLIAPTVQMVFRRGLAAVADEAAAYLSPAAHPVVVRREAIDLAAMVEIANRLTPETVPPRVVLRVAQDLVARPGIDLMGEGLSERLFDTPSAVARIWRSLAPSRRVVLDARGTEGAADGGLRFHWVVTRGDPAKVRIAPRGPGGAVAEIEIDWHRPAPAPPGGDPEAPPITSHRIDIAVIADNGAELSAPAFFSLALPPRQERSYTALPGGGMALDRVDYAAPGRAGLHADPLLFPARGWRDAMERDEAGRLLGWTRHYRGGAPRVERYTRHGLLVEKTDAAGRPVRARRMRYPSTPRGPEGRAVIRPAPGEAVFLYRYSGPDDALGRLVPAPGGEGEAVSPE